MAWSIIRKIMEQVGEDRYHDDTSKCKHNNTQWKKGKNRQIRLGGVTLPSPGAPGKGLPHCR